MIPVCTVFFLTFSVEVVFVESCAEVYPLYHIRTVGLSVVGTVTVSPIGVASVQQGETPGQTWRVPILTVGIGLGLSR